LPWRIWTQPHFGIDVRPVERFRYFLVLERFRNQFTDGPDMSVTPSSIAGVQRNVS
jgi:hypothetical protein